MHLFLVCFLVGALITCSFALPLWKVFCTTTPLFRGRADPIVDPGTLSQHSHKVWGGNNFGIGTTPVDTVKYYNMIRASSCTTCSIALDLSNYWVPDLYYQWPNGSLSLVPNGGLTVYYPSRGGSLPAQVNPKLTPFPPGLRMTAGSPWRRSYNDSSVADMAISYACLGGTDPQTPYFPTNETECPDGLRAQVWFPMCWDGVNLDSANHQSHMSYPIQAPDNGDCPDSHPVRVPGIFFEILFDVNPSVYPQGQGVNPFRWSCGDSTGYGLHGDFISGWDVNLVAAALADPMCDLSLNPNLAYGNNVTACPPMAPYVKANNPDGACNLAEKITTVEDLGFAHLSNRLPGCNPITGYSETPVTPCTAAQPAIPIPSPSRRVLLKSVSNGKYLTIANINTPLFANQTDDVNLLGYSEVFMVVPNTVNSDGGFLILSESSEQFLTAPNSGKNLMTADRGSASDWEVFFLTYNSNGSIVTIQANSNQMYVSVQPDATVLPNAVTAGTTEQFYIIDASSITQNPPPAQDVPDSGEEPEETYDGTTGANKKITSTSSGSSLVASLFFAMVGNFILAIAY